MEEFSSTVRAIRFGIFEVDLRAGELRKKGIRIKLQGRPFFLLLTLLKRRGELVTREELRRTLWPEDTFIDVDHSLGTGINKLREILGDSATSPRFIETLPRRGYRFIAPIEIVGKDEEVPEVDPSSTNVQDERTGNLAPREHKLDDLPKAAALSWRTRWPRPWMAVILAATLILGMLLLLKLRPAPSPQADVRSLAVLPLENLSGDASQDYFSDGMTDELITQLGQISELRVISRTSVMTYKRVRKPLPQIARELNVEAVVEGTVLRAGNRVRITAQLILAPADKHLWAQSYEGELRDTLALQHKVALAIAEQIRIKLSTLDRPEMKRTKDVNPEAYEAYLRGRYFWNKRTGDGLKKAVDYFNQAIEKDPTYAQAYAGLSDSYALMGDWEYSLLAPAEAFPKAKASAIRALALDDSLGEAHASLAFVLDLFDWDWESAEREYRRAVDLNPSYATAHQWYAWHLIILARNSESLSEWEKHKT